MSNAKMMDIVDLALGVNQANDVLTVPSMPDIQERNRQYQLGRMARQNAEDASWNKYEAQSEYKDYRPSTMNGFKPLYADFDGSVFTPSTEPTEDLGGMGGNLRAPSNLVTADTTNYNLGQQTAPVESGNVDDEKKNEVEAEFNQAFSIEALIALLQNLGNLQPGGNPGDREELFQLDTMYKGSSPMYGMQGTPAGYPKPQGNALMGLNLGTMGDNDARI